MSKKEKITHKEAKEILQVFGNVPITQGVYHNFEDLTDEEVHQIYKKLETYIKQQEKLGFLIEKVLDAQNQSKFQMMTILIDAIGKGNEYDELIAADLIAEYAERGAVNEK